MLVYRAFIQVFPCQGNRVHCCSHISALRVSSPPPPSLSHVGNFYTLTRFFTTHARARRWAAFVVTTHTQGLSQHPIALGGQLSLF
jgi:hypothetical protein